jgi:hypothetical protein
MATSDRRHLQPGTTVSSRVGLGAVLVGLAGLGHVAWGLMVLLRTFPGAELHLNPQHAGSTPEQIWALSPDLYGYIIHLQVVLAGYVTAFGVAVIVLAWYGIRRGEHWALWTTLASALITAVVAVPLNYPYGVGTLGHLGLHYLGALTLLVGTALAYSGLAKEEH